jgi:hypothetical protein
MLRNTSFRNRSERPVPECGQRLTARCAPRTVTSHDLCLPGWWKANCLRVKRAFFTGALMQKQGRFELADRGTLFLDEIGDTDSPAMMPRTLPHW